MFGFVMFYSYGCLCTWYMVCYFNILLVWYLILDCDFDYISLVI